MRHGVLAHLNADVAAAHFVRHCRSGAGAEKGVEDEVAGVGGDMEDTLNKAFGFWSSENFTAKQLYDFLFCVLCVTNIFVVPESLWNDTLFHLAQINLRGGDVIAGLSPPYTSIAVHLPKFFF